MRAGHSLAAHPGVDEVVVIGPASSKSFQVVSDASSCDLVLGSGEVAISLAKKHSVRLIWDGAEREEGVAVWGANPEGLAMALAAREPDPRLVAVAHPDIDANKADRAVRFPNPVGRISVEETMLGGRPLARAKSPNEYAACLAVGASRRVTVVDDAAFLSGVALAAAFAVVGDEPLAVWEKSLVYLEAATQMGLVMAESD